MIIAAVVPLLCCIIFGLLYLLVGNKTPPASPTTSKLVTLFLWFCVCGFLVVMFAVSHSVFRVG